MELYAVRHKASGKLMCAPGYPARTNVGGKLYKQRYWAEQLRKWLAVTGRYRIAPRYKPEELEIVTFMILEVLDAEALAKESEEEWKLPSF